MQPRCLDDPDGKGVSKHHLCRIRLSSAVNRLGAKTGAKGSVTNCKFEVAGSTDYPCKDYGLVAFFDCFHDMGNPAGAARHVKKTLKANGAWMIVEPYAHETVGKT